MNVKKTLVTTVLLVVGMGAMFAATPVYLSTSVKGLGTPIMPITVETPTEIIQWFEEQGMDETQIDEYSSLPLVIIDYNADRESPFFNTCNFNAGRAALWEHAMG